MRPRLALIIAALSLVFAGACTDGRLSYLDHKMVILADNLAAKPTPDTDRVLEFDLIMDDYAFDKRLFYDAIVEEIKACPTLSMRNHIPRGVEYEQAPPYPRKSPAAATLSLSIDYQFHGHWYNYFLGFPGMIPLLPTVYGFFYELDMTLKGLLRMGEHVARFECPIRIEVREKNSPRSVAVHYWPTNGYLTSQFWIGIVWSLYVVDWKSEYSTPLLLKVLGPRFGRHFSSKIEHLCHDFWDRHPVTRKAGR